MQSVLEESSRRNFEKEGSEKVFSAVQRDLQTFFFKSSQVLKHETIGQKGEQYHTMACGLTTRVQCPMLKL